MTESSSPQSSEVDVLIVGAGPAGLMLALWMARLGVKTRIVDKRTDKVFSGQADGFQVRTLEILDSFGIGERVWKESNQLHEVSFWNPDESGKIQRNARTFDTSPGLSRFHETVLHQGRMETFFNDAIRISASETHPEIHVERRVMPSSLRIDEHTVNEKDAYPIEITLRHLSEAEATPTQRLSNLQDGLFRSNLSEDDTKKLLETGGRDATEEIVRAKFVVGCDGAHSWVRKTLGKDYEMEGESTDAIWGVLDIVPITDFPDIRNRCVVHSAEAGTLMVIPRENRLVRLYIQLKEVSAGSGRVDRSQITPDIILKTAQNILMPYKLEYHYIDWWTAYQIGQRSGNHFSKLNRVFLAGDAVHTHSPKAGQGMNVSMQDTYNLGWKLGLVCKNVLRPDVLSTYEWERKQIAKELIAFDQKFSKLFTGQPASVIQEETGVSTTELQEAFKMSHMFTTGVGICYRASPLVSADFSNEPETGEQTEKANPARSTPELAKNCKPGTRFPSFWVVSQSDARPWELHHHMPSDGRFRIVIFGGVISNTAQLQIVNELGEWLSSELLPRLPVVALSPASAPHTGSLKFKTENDPSVVDVLLVHAAKRQDVELIRDLHEAYHPFDAKLGWDYEKVFVDGPGYHRPHGRAYEGYGVDPEKGAVVVVRPDGYVGLVTGLGDEGRAQVKLWFETVLEGR